jgi:hypothetical protein
MFIKPFGENYSHISQKIVPELNLGKDGHSKRFRIFGRSQKKREPCTNLYSRGHLMKYY